MTQSQKMRKALEEKVISKLLIDGFIGEYPDYRKVYPNRIELISFPKYKHGNAFYVLASVAYQNKEKEKQNIDFNYFKGDFNELIADDCGGLRYYLKGNFGDLFYYTDVYWQGGALGCIGVSEEKAKSYKRKWYELHLQRYNENIYNKICNKINKKLPKIYKWWAKMSKKETV